MEAIENAIRNPKPNLSSEEEEMYKKVGEEYYRNIMQNNPIYTIGDGIIEFSSKNREKTLPVNYKQYPDIRKLILTSKKGINTNTKNEKDRFYKHYLNNYEGNPYDYVIESLKNNRNIFKMIKKKGTNIVPYKKNTEIIPYEDQ